MWGVCRTQGLERSDFRPEAVTLIDTRNEYEIDVGTFEYAVNPHTGSFRTFPEYVEQELADKKTKKLRCFARVESAAKNRLLTSFNKASKMSITSRGDFKIPRGSAQRKQSVEGRVFRL